MPYGVLVIEDEATLAKNVRRYLERHGYDVRVAGTGEEGLTEFATFKPDVVLLDFNLPGRNGLEILAAVRGMDRQVKVILLTGHGSVQVAVDAMKGGAYDYISKPLVLSELKLLVDKAVGQERMEGALTYYREKEAGESGLARIVGRSPAVQRMRERIGQILEAEKHLASGPPPAVLITGETGTGKELVARALHYDGMRRDHPFVEINCASIPSHLLESELFGYERGAFTDARERKIGLVEAAHQGTLFLDEIGDMDPAVQVKVLKLLEDRKVRRLGSTRDLDIDIRIVTATNRRLEELVDNGDFRADLLYRLRVIQIDAPPLRERGDDIMVLAEHFLDDHGRRYGKPDLRFSPEVRKALLAHGWPGNVRELRNLVEQLVLLASGPVIEIDQLPMQPRPAPAPINSASGDGLDRLIASLSRPDMKLEDVERGLIVEALTRSNWNVTRAAEALGLSRDTLRYRIEKFGLQPPA